MIVESPKDFFEFLLSSAAEDAERLPQALEQLSRDVEDKNIGDVLNAQAIVLRNMISVLGRCFRFLGCQRTETHGRLLDMFIEEHRRDLAEISSPTARRLCVLTQASALIQFSIGEFATLIAIAEMIGNSGVCLLLDGCLAENTAFIERTKRLIGSIVEGNGATTHSAISGQRPTASTNKAYRMHKQ